MFSFLSGDKCSGIDKHTLKSINDEVIHFLHARDVLSFRVFTIDCENNPVVLIQAIPQKKLRFSNILEFQIKRHLRERLGFQVPAVFWRFKMNNNKTPGPEQADYEFDEKPEYPQDISNGESILATPHGGIATTEKSEDVSDNHNEHYDVRQLARKGMKVEEISMSEFDEFLKGTSTPSADPQ